MEPNCAVQDCDKPLKTPGSVWCMKHYMRWYRHGDVTMNARSKGAPSASPRCYISVYLPRHPLAGRTGKVMAHRAVLYDKIGPGPHPCYWCHTLIDWLPKDQPNTITTDHLNSIKDDNRPGNLVASCRRCNGARGSKAWHDRLVAAGWFARRDDSAHRRVTDALRFDVEAP